MLLIVGESQLALDSLTARGMDSKWWTLGSANLLEASQLQSVIEAAYSLMRLGEVKSAESLLKPFLMS